MKRTLLLNFVVFATGIALNIAPSMAVPTGAIPRVEATKTPTTTSGVAVTRDNFISLSLQKSGGFAGINTTLEVQGNVLSDFPSGRSAGTRTGGAAQRSESVRTYGLSNNQVKQLIDKINEFKLTALVGNYKQKGLMDGFNETLTITISDSNNNNQQFVINNYGNAAPKSYFEFLTFFNALVQMKMTGAPRSMAALASASARSG